MVKRYFVTLCLFGVIAAVGCGEDAKKADPLTSEIGYDEGDSRIVVILNRDLNSGEQLHARVRSLADSDQLDCGAMASSIPRLSESSGNHQYSGPQVQPEDFKTSTSPETLLGESADAHQQRLASTFFVDICVMAEGKTRHQARYDIRQALDRRGSAGKLDAHDDGVRLASNQAYAEACISEMGDIPFWGERISEDGEPDWGTVDCVEIGTPIPSEVDGVPQEERVDQCDNPQYIYNHCEPDARTGANGPRVAHERNEEGTHWVLLCRKSHTAEGRYNDMAMIGHNPFTGQTCFFQNQLPSGDTPRPSNDGTNIPHPADDVQSEDSPQTWADLWGGIEGGIGPEGGIQCQGCHSTDPFIHTPWIDGAVDDDGEPVVPKMGENPDFVEGYNGPYKLIDAEDQGWSEPKHLVSEEADACTSCHRIGLDQWTASSSIRSQSNEDGGCVFCGYAPWFDRLEQADDTWEQLVTESHREFDEAFWMPPDAPDVLNEELWVESEYKAAMDFIRSCGENPDEDACKWESLPKEPGNPTELPTVDETGIDLAQEALTVLGAPYVVDGEEHESSRRCGECHATSTHGMIDWLEGTLDAVDAGIDVRSDPDELSQEEAAELVNYMREGDEDSVYAAYKLGVFSSGVQFPYFQKLFQKAYGAGWGLEYGAFLQRVSMPKGSHPPLSGREFAVVAKWFVDERLEHLEDLLVEQPPPATCDEVRAQYDLTEPKPWLQNHIEDMEFDGWAARNEENGINMFGCENSDPLDCFADADPKEEWSSGAVDAARMVQIRELDFSTSFWTRTSADGRFVGNGGGNTDGFRATITDLVTDKNIGVSGSYDPGFFPNNDGFIMQGAGAGLCSQSVLTRQDAIEDGIDFTEDGCNMAEGINLYQHVAVSLAGDYFVINSEFTSDSGGGTRDPKAPFYEGSTMKFSPLVFDGTEWTQKPAVIVDSPYEGDSVLSPSGRMVISRFAGPEGTALGYMVRRVEAVPNANDSYDIDISLPVQFLCEPGAKGNISFDERWSVTHHYENDTANIYLSDLLTAETYQITDMPEGTKALFPHFRSDGWIYFLAKGDGTDHIVASDAAIRLAGQQ